MIVLKLTPEQRKLVDEYRDVREKWKGWQPAVNPHAARYAEIGKELLELTEKQEAADNLLLQGDRYAVPVSARRLTRTIVNLPKLFKRLGAKWVQAHCKPTLTDLEKSPLTPNILAQHITENRDGVRTLGEPVATQAVSTAAA